MSASPPEDYNYASRKGGVAVGEAVVPGSDNNIKSPPKSSELHSLLVNSLDRFIVVGHVPLVKEVQLQGLSYSTGAL